MNKVHIDDLAKEIHLTAKASGFWDEERNMGEMLMLIVSELAEALEEHRDNKSLFYRNYLGKPEGIIIELADAAIRILDTVYSEWDTVRHGLIRTHVKSEMKSQLSLGVKQNKYTVGDNFAENLLRATAFVLRGEQNVMWLVAALVYLDRLAISLQADLWDAVDLKMEFNKTRPYKHGKAY